MKRRKFLKQVGTGSVIVLSGSIPVRAFAQMSELSDIKNGDYNKLTILHTNDVHSHIEPFPDDGGKYANLGGAERRSILINTIRKEEENVLLLDAGDMWQGTPYFNLFEGEVAYRVMNLMDYDVATLGNHDFDGKLIGLKKQLPVAKFDIVNCNYDFSDTILNGSFKPYKILHRQGIKIGVLGVGVELIGLVGKAYYGNTVYLDPIEQANKYAAELKEHKCDLIVCLSHLGYKYEGNKVSDIVLAENSHNIDIIIGGHTHTFMNKPDVRKNKDGNQVVIHQVGWAGIILGRIDVFLDKSREKMCIRCRNHWVKV